MGFIYMFYLELLPVLIGLFASTQSEEHFAAHNRNNSDFIELNLLPSCLICFPVEKQSTETYTAYTIYYFDQAYFEDTFEERNNSINQLLYSTTFEQQSPDFEYLNHQIHIWIIAHQLAITSFETEEESYQTAPIFDIFLSNSDHSTQTVTPEPMANNPIGDAQDPIEWLDDFKKAATANQYDNEYKFQIIGGYLQSFPATWFSQKTDAGAYQRIIRWTPTNAREKNTSFTIWFENKFRTPILISKWQMELERKTQSSGEVVTEYAKAIRKLIKQVDFGRNWTEEQKIHSFTKGLRTDLSYVLWSLLALKDNPTMNMTIELAQRIKDNQRMHLGFTLPVFAPALVITSALQMATTSFAIQIQDPNEQLIDKLIVNLQPLYQRQQNCGPPVCYYCGLTGHFSKDCNNSLLSPPAFRNNDTQNNRPNNINQRPNHTNINFFGENLLVEATGESTSQPEKNLFYVFNLTDYDHNINELAINTLELTRKKKKAKVDFVLNPNKPSISTADNNEPPKTKVFKNLPKLELSEIVQKSGPYSIVKDLMETPAHIIFGQLMTHPQFRKDLCKSLIPKKKTPKTNKCPCQAGLADNSNVTPLICKAQVAGYFIDLILDSKSSVSVIAKHFLEAIGRKIDKPFTQPMTNIHGDKKKDLSIAKAVSV
ncbi:hypothetical protein G9A89_011781 [Geosiphon pyriformis]|nr:hypothetical protein G9A89_011781 [Geosiphon pyriformis]